MTRHLSIAVAMGLVSLTALLTWYWANGLESSNPYPAPFYWCGAESVPAREAFVAECRATIDTDKLGRLGLDAWCEELAKGIYCRQEAGDRYSRISGGLAEQTKVVPCSGATSRAERVVCGRGE